MERYKQGWSHARGSLVLMEDARGEFVLYDDLPKWVDARFRLPENDEVEVLIRYIDGHGDHRVDTAYLVGRGVDGVVFDTGYERVPVRDVSHWMSVDDLLRVGQGGSHDAAGAPRNEDLDQGGMSGPVGGDRGSEGV